MEPNNIVPGPIHAERNIYKLEPGGGQKEAPRVHPDRVDLARAIDKDADGVLSNQEIKEYMRETGILKDPAKAAVNERALLIDYKRFLKNEPLPQAKGYPTFDEVTNHLKDLAAKYPDMAQLVSLGKSVEGRDIWALKIGKGAGTAKPGVVFTGIHHAREWISMMPVLKLGDDLLAGYGKDPAMTKRVDVATTWIVPIVNPDGYVYTRTADSMWRKNREPVYETGCPVNADGEIAGAAAGKLAGAVPADGTGRGKPVAMGVDLNRNYEVPGHPELYRPKSDKPCNTWDDFGATSDDPGDETYRGTSGNSEPETKALLNMELGQNNIKGVIDHHSYGEMILYPWGVTHTPTENASEYKSVAAKMSQAMEDPYKPMQSIDLYPTAGDSTDAHNATGKLAITIEMGQSFQPAVSRIDSIQKNVAAADLVFLDYIVGKYGGADAASEGRPA